MPYKPLLNLFRNSIPHLVFALLFAVGKLQAHAGETGHETLPHTCLLCNISGPTSITVGSAGIYNLTGACTAAGWTVTNGATILRFTSTTVTIVFNNTGTTNIETAGGTGGGASLNVTVTVAPLSGGAINNPSQTIDFGNTPAPITATTATGGTCGTSYTYQWYSSTDGSNYSPISGATGVNYQPGALTVTTFFKRLSSCSGATSFSNVATVTVNAQLQPGTITNPGQTIEFGGTPTQISAGTSSGGGCGTSYGYQWQVSTDGTNFSNISGATGQNYQPGTLTVTTYYRRMTTCNGVTVMTTNATVIVNPQLQPGTITNPTQAIGYGGAPTQISAGTSSGGGCGTSYGYQWQVSTDGSNFSNISGANGQNYQPGALTVTTYYRRVTSCNGVTVMTINATVAVDPQLLVGTVNPATQTINFGATPQGLALSAVSGGNGVYTYQWQISTDPSFGTIANIGSNSSSFSPASPTVATYYRVMVTSNGAVAYSSSAVINVVPALSGGAISGNSAPINYNSRPGTMTDTQDATGGACSGNYTYQWQYSFDGTNWHDLINASGNTYSSPVGLTISEYFRRQASCSGINAYSNTIHVQVNSQKQSSCTQ